MSLLSQTFYLILFARAVESMSLLSFTSDALLLSCCFFSEKEWTVDLGTVWATGEPSLHSLLL